MTSVCRKYTKNRLKYKSCSTQWLNAFLPLSSQQQRASRSIRTRTWRSKGLLSRKYTRLRGCQSLTFSMRVLLRTCAKLAGFKVKRLAELICKGRRISLLGQQSVLHHQLGTVQLKLICQRIPHSTLHLSLATQSRVGSSICRHVTINRPCHIKNNDQPLSSSKRLTRQPRSSPTRP